jgi:predicted MPP superfamily phosphohydrolase
MRSPLGLIIFILILLLIDYYIFQSVKTIYQTYSNNSKQLIGIVFWSVSSFNIITIVLFNLFSKNFSGNKFFTYLFSIVIGIIIAKIIAVLFFLIDDIRRVLQWGFVKTSTIINSNSEQEVNISRSVFMSWLGIAASGTLFGTLLYGFKNKYSYQLRKEKLHFKNLPAAFRGLKILHISDIHAGSFLDKKDVELGIDLILKQQADLILFTGDLVNNAANEMKNYKDLFSLIKAPLGVYSVLGNHDYGDYVQWPQDGISKEENLNLLKQTHAEMGWNLLMNQHQLIEKEGEIIAILGIENWSAKGNFPKYGDLKKAYEGSEKYPFKILLSHDPSHWHAQVRKDYKDIDLTLSGHTHGMQFGVELPGFKWSPIQYVYKEWAGLYEELNAKLYVNRGFGFLGYPGRVGILPEITLIELA